MQKGRRVHQLDTSLDAPRRASYEQLSFTATVKVDAEGDFLYMLASAVLLEINPHHPEPRKISRAVDILESGKLLAYPTDTVYGLGCDLLNKGALDRLYAAKNMPRTQSLALICVDLSDIARYVLLDNQAYRLLRRLLPGPYTFILPATREVPKTIAPKRTQVGIRIPAHPVPRAIAQALGRPLISTTAGPHGGEPLQFPQDIATSFREIDLILDGGPGGIEPTTVIDLTQNPPVIVRAGAGPIDVL